MNRLRVLPRISQIIGGKDILQLRPSAQAASRKLASRAPGDAPAPFVREHREREGMPKKGLDAMIRYANEHNPEAKKPRKRAALAGDVGAAAMASSAGAEGEESGGQQPPRTGPPTQPGGVPSQQAKKPRGAGQPAQLPGGRPPPPVNCMNAKCAQMPGGPGKVVFRDGENVSEKCIVCGKQVALRIRK